MGVLSLIAVCFLGEPCTVQTRPLKAGVRGLASYPAWAGRQITLAPGMGRDELLWVFAHELGHHVLGHVRPELCDTYLQVRKNEPIPEVVPAGEARGEYDLHEREADAWVDRNLETIERLVDLALSRQRGQ